MDQELNYVNYFTEIERHFQVRRESFTLLCTLDWAVVDTWKEQGVPLETVLKGIDRAFSRPKGKRKINKLAYCIKAVEQVIEEQKDLAVDAPHLPDFAEDEVRTYIAKLADEVSQVDAGIAATIRGIDSNDLRAAEQSLSALEEKLIARLKSSMDDRTMIEVKQEVDQELNPFRSTMTAAQLTMLEQQMWRRKLLERCNLPRLSLFYLI